MYYLTVDKNWIFSLFEEIPMKNLEYNRWEGKKVQFLGTDVMIDAKIFEESTGINPYEVLTWDYISNTDMDKSTILPVDDKLIKKYKKAFTTHMKEFIREVRSWKFPNMLGHHCMINSEKKTYLEL